MKLLHYAFYAFLVGIACTIALMMTNGSDPKNWSHATVFGHLMMGLGILAFVAALGMAVYAVGKMLVRAAQSGPPGTHFD